MGVAAGKLPLGILSKGVVPDHPVTQVQVGFARDDSHLCCVFVADGHPHAPSRLEHAAAGGHPFFGPRIVLPVGLAVPIDVVFVPNVEWGVGKDHIHLGQESFADDPDTVAGDDTVRFNHTGKMI
jgi:hypothetical protein